MRYHATRVVPIEAPARRDHTGEIRLESRRVPVVLSQLYWSVLYIWCSKNMWPYSMCVVLTERCRRRGHTGEIRLWNRRLPALLAHIYYPKLDICCSKSMLFYTACVVLPERRRRRARDAKETEQNGEIPMQTE
jgi:hypothetical protein